MAPVIVSGTRLPLANPIPGTRIPIQSREHWFELRGPRIGASDVPTLFGVGYRSPFDLHYEKHKDLPPEDLSENPRVVIGRNLEDGIAGAAADLHGFKLRKCDYYLIDAVEPGLGCTLDFELLEGTDFYPAEIKNESWGSHKDHWITHDDGTVEPPLRFLLQVQAQLACTGAPRGLLIVLVAGDRIVHCMIERHEPAIAEIRRRVAAFWKAVANHTPPPAEMPRDLGTAKLVWPAGEGEADLRGDPDIEGWLKTLAELRSHRASVQHEIETVEGQVLAYCTKHKFAAITAQAGRISCKQKPAKPERQVTYKAQPSKVELRIST